MDKQTIRVKSRLKYYIISVPIFPLQDVVYHHNHYTINRFILPFATVFQFEPECSSSGSLCRSHAAKQLITLCDRAHKKKKHLPGVPEGAKNTF